MARKNKSVVEAIETVEVTAPEVVTESAPNGGVTVEVIESEVVGLMEVTTEVVTESVVETEVTETEVIEQPSMLAAMLNQEVKPLDEVKVEDKPVTTSTEKNIGVGQLVRKLIADGMLNKDILKVVHEQYGNTNTTYACVAWYRNKMKKNAVAKAQSSAVESVTKMLEVEESTS